MDLAVRLDKGEDDMHDLENKDKKIQPVSPFLFNIDLKVLAAIQ